MVKGEGRGGIEDEEEHCEMLSSGYGMAATIQIPRQVRLTHGTCMRFGPSLSHHDWRGTYEAPPLPGVYWLLMAAEGRGAVFSSGVAIGKLSCSNK